MPDVRPAVALIATAYFRSHAVSAAHAPGIVRMIHASLEAELAAMEPPPEVRDNVDRGLSPHVSMGRPPVKRMGRPRNSETTRCLHCGNRYRDLAQHVARAHGMTIDRYQNWFAATELPPQASDQPWASAR